MAKNSLFRSGLGGYNKNDVNRYIEELGIQFTEKENELESEIKELKKELEVLPSLKAEKEKAIQLTSEVELLKKENNDISDAIKSCEKELEAKKNELYTVTSEKDALELRIKELSEREEKLNAENAKIKAEFEIKVKELEELAKETEVMKQNLENDKSEFEKRAEEMLLQIQAQAKAVIDKANETSELIISNAKKKAVDISKGVVSYTTDTVAKKKDGLSDILENHKSKMDSFFAAITRTFTGDGK